MFECVCDACDVCDVCMCNFNVMYNDGIYSYSYCTNRTDRNWVLTMSNSSRYDSFFHAFFIFFFCTIITMRKYSMRRGGGATTARAGKWWRASAVMAAHGIHDTYFVLLFTACMTQPMWANIFISLFEEHQIHAFTSNVNDVRVWGWLQMKCGSVFIPSDNSDAVHFPSIQRSIYWHTTKRHRTKRNTKKKNSLVCVFIVNWKSKYTHIFVVW